MVEPTNAELLTHIKYISAKVDETASDVKDLKKSDADKESRLVRLEERSTKTAGMIGALGALAGGIAAGLGIKIGS
jgi:hypothetical protein